MLHVNTAKQCNKNRLLCCDTTRYFSWDIPREEFTELAIRRLPWWPVKTENAPGTLLLGLEVDDEKLPAECAMPRRDISKLKLSKPSPHQVLPSYIILHLPACYHKCSIHNHHTADTQLWTQMQAHTCRLWRQKRSKLPSKASSISPTFLTTYSRKQ